MKECISGAACMGRREFLVKAGLVAGGVVLTVSSFSGAAAAAAFEDVTVAVGADSPLAKVGGFAYADSSAGKIIVIRTGEATYAAFSAICTHKRGLLSYDAGKKVLECPKHGSKFDGSTGKVLGGPAESPVANYPATEASGSVTIKVG